MCKRIARGHAHSLKVRAQVHSAQARGQWYKKRTARLIHRRVRTQAPALLHLAGDWKEDAVERSSTHHRMRVMLLANLYVEQRFANGTQGRLLYWRPGRVLDGKPLHASDPELVARFVKEASHGNDFTDVEAKTETVSAGCGRHATIQLPLAPAYALIVHKTQALSIPYIVRGCVEGVFAQGQVYVLVNRVTDPQNFQLVGVPPRDLLDVATAWQEAGLDVNKCFEAAVRVTGDFTYACSPLGTCPCSGVSYRLQPRMRRQQQVPTKCRKLEEILNAAAEGGGRLWPPVELD